MGGWNTFGGNVREAIYWRIVVGAYTTGGWRWYYHTWQHYTASTPSGGGGGEGVGGGGFEVQYRQEFKIPSNLWTRMAVESWTRPTGYCIAWVNNRGYGASYWQNAYCLLQ